MSQFVDEQQQQLIIPVQESIQMSAPKDLLSNVKLNTSQIVSNLQ